MHALRHRSATLATFVPPFVVACGGSDDPPPLAVATPKACETAAMAGITLANAALTAASGVPAGTYQPAGSFPLANLPAFCLMTASATPTSSSLVNFGPDYKPQDESGIATVLPPAYLNRDYAILVPQVDATTGLTKAGIRSVEARVPLGTSIEFNYVATPGIVDLSNLTGSFIPFHKTQAARVAAGDGRPSLEERYVNQAGYVAAVTTAAGELVAQRLLLQRDADAIIARANANAVLP